jgi:hypothetical protein
MRKCVVLFVYQRLIMAQDHGDKQEALLSIPILQDSVLSLKKGKPFIVKGLPKVPRRRLELPRV